VALGIDQAVDQFVDAHFVARDLAGGFQHFGDGGRAGRNGHDHVLEAILDALGDFDFAFAREQFDRAHLAHVHAHRVGGAAEFGIDGGQAPARLPPRPPRHRPTAGADSFSSRSSAAGASSKTWIAMSLKVEMIDSICSASTRSSGRWSLISA
jgi:hypothetical protein